MRPASLKYQPTVLEGFVEGTLSHLRREVICRENPLDFPLMLNIEPTNDCNLFCYVCPRRKSWKKVGYMKLHIFKKIIDEAKKYRLLYMLNLHKDGESLLHPEFPKMISIARREGVSKIIHFNTNGVLLKGRTAREILDSGIDDITVSVDAATPETFKKIKGRDLLDTVERNIKDFISIRNKGGYKRPFLRVKIMQYRDTEKEIDEFIKKWEGVVDEVQISGIHDWAKGIKQVKPSTYLPKKRYPCAFLWFALAINWDGGVGLCCVDWKRSNTLENINEKTLHEIWQSPKMKKIRFHHVNENYEKVPSCCNCDNWAGGEDLSDWMAEQKDFYR